MFNLQREDGDDLFLPLYKAMINRMKELWGTAQIFGQELAVGSGCLLQVHAIYLRCCGMGQQKAEGNQHTKPHTTVFPPTFPSWGRLPSSVSEQRDIPELQNNPLKPRNLMPAQP